MKVKTNLFDQIYKIVKLIPSGSVMTYGQIAKMVGTKDTRKIGWALHANPDQLTIPCHRVVNKDGRLAPGYVFGGPNEQKSKLLAEGVEFIDDNHVKL